MKINDVIFFLRSLVPFKIKKDSIEPDENSKTSDYKKSKHPPIQILTSDWLP